MGAPEPLLPRASPSSETPGGPVGGQHHWGSPIPAPREAQAPANHPHSLGLLQAHSRAQLGSHGRRSPGGRTEAAAAQPAWPVPPGQSVRPVAAGLSAGSIHPQLKESLAQVIGARVFIAEETKSIPTTGRGVYGVGCCWLHAQGTSPGGGGIYSEVLTADLSHLGPHCARHWTSVRSISVA